MKRIRSLCLAACLLVVALVTRVRATETEHFGIQVLPAPGAVKIDGKFGDWDLSGSVFACGDAESQRDKFAVWISTMADADNLYILARWRDATPMNNPGSSKGDMGFQGDCLQFRIITGAGTPEQRVSQWTCWRDRDGIDLMDVHWGSFGGKKSDYERDLKDAKIEGAQQAFAADADGSGYVQEMAIPWKLLTANGAAVKAGQQFAMTMEPNFTIGTSGRLTIKDIFRAGVTLDKVFTFMADSIWGIATVEAAGKVQPRSVRLADAREFPVRMESGLPVVDWTGVIKVKELPGFMPVAFEMPQDGYVSLIIRNAEGQVVRQLLNCAFYVKGKHEVKWDGLSNWAFRTPGTPVAAGNYTWSAIYHTGIGLRLRGWACNAGSAPWDASDTTNWGGDHGVPVTAASDGQRIYLGWSGAEAGRAVVAVNPKAEVQWRQIRGGMGGAQLIAVDGKVIYVQNGASIYRVEPTEGAYTAWAGGDSPDLLYKSMIENAPDHADGLAARGGSIYISFKGLNTIAVVDGNSGKLTKKLDVQAPEQIAITADGKLLVVSAGQRVLAVDPASGQSSTFVEKAADATGIAVDKAGVIYVGTRAPDNQVFVFSADGKPTGTIGRKGGRAPLGPWQPDGMMAIAGMVADGEGQLWVTEADASPKRVSVWNTSSGKLVMELFGPTHYGASGGAILPDDPNIMVGEGCEWKLDPKTGRAVCTGVFEQGVDGFARFAKGSNGQTYLITCSGMHSRPTYRIHQRLGEGNYKLRAIIDGGEAPKDPKKEPAAQTTFWADANDDGQQQPDEVQTLPGVTNSSGYIGITHFVNADLTFYGNNTPRGAIRVPVSGFTACNAPKYNLGAIAAAPALGLASLDNRLLLEPGENLLRCFDLTGGKLLWTFPNTFSGVHGSHYAPGPDVGLVRGILGVVGSAKLPDPVGTVFGFNSNVGEWYLFTQDGYFLTSLFQSDPMRFQWPEKAIPGAILDSCPCGMGGEDFGGSLQQGADGRIYIQAGKVGLWNVEVTGLETIKPLANGSVALSDEGTKQAQIVREQALQANAGTGQLAAKNLTPKFTGNIETDFRGAEPVAFKKTDDSAVRAVMAWDEQNLYIGWDVQDRTPWINGADAPEFLYARGDTVDLQLGTDPKAKKDRSDPVLGDLRLSIGSLKGKPTAVIFRKVAEEKHPKTFSSGVIREYPVDSVVVVENAQIEVKKRGNGYVVEASIPLAALGLKPTDGLTIRGDVGATHSDPGGTDTALRTYWNNQQTGIVNDEVFELKMEPKNWGEIVFKK